MQDDDDYELKFADKGDRSDETDGKWSMTVQVVGSIYYFVAGIAGLTLLILIFVKGLIWYSDYAYPTVSVIATLPIIFLFPLGLIFGLFRKVRGLGGVFLVICSLLYLGAIWAQSLEFAYAYVGKIWMLVGFFLAGVGVFFMAMLGGIIQGQYMDSILIFVSLVIVVIVHIAGSSMAASADKYLRHGSDGDKL
ncbi:hypothetical protein BH20ACI2_BH20ACI2_25710 [soil metagenome]